MNKPLAIVSVAVLGMTFFMEGASQQTSGQSKSPTPKSSIQSLLERLEQSDLDLIERDRTGAVVSITLYAADANDLNLKLISPITSVRTLTIQGPNEYLTRDGIAQVRYMTNVENLTLSCIKQMRSGILDEICNLRTLRKLSLNASCPPAGEYASIGRLPGLLHLSIDYCEGFTDKELSSLTNLSSLTSIELVRDSISRTGTNILNQLSNVTNACIIFREK